MKTLKTVFPYNYLSLRSTYSFIKAAKSYLSFCEYLVKTPPSTEVLVQLQPYLLEVYYRASKLKDLSDEEPNNWQEIGEENEGVYYQLLQFLVNSIGDHARFECPIQPLASVYQTRGFFIDELIADMYLSFIDNIYRIESLATPTEIHTGLFLFHKGFRENWGPECAALLSSLHYPTSVFHKTTGTVFLKQQGLNQQN